MSKEKCSLCGFEIAPDESAYVLNDEVVCSECHRINASRKSTSAEPPIAPNKGETTKAHEAPNREGRMNPYSRPLQDPTRDTKILNTYSGVLRVFGYIFFGIGVIGALISVITSVMLFERSGKLTDIGGGVGMGLIILAAGCLAMFWIFVSAAFVSAFSSLAQNVYNAAVNRDLK
jgi:hypothetical protein